jgi:hypothetical protein
MSKLTAIAIIATAIAATGPALAGNKPANAGGPPTTAPGQVLKESGVPAPGEKGASQSAPGQLFDKTDPGANKGASGVAPGKNKS